MKAPQKRTKIEKIGRIFTKMACDPISLRQVIDEEMDTKQYVEKKHGLGSGFPMIDILDLLPDFNESVDPYSFMEGTSLPIDLALLKALARKYKKCRYMEIGTWRGESIANVASVADECISIDLSEEDMIKRGLSKRIIKNVRFFSKKIKNIKCIDHDSQTLDFSGLGKFDLIFLDGDHHYESVRVDTANAFKLLKDKDSMIVWHDYGFSPETVRWSVMAGIVDGCPPQKRKSLYHVSNTLCAIYTTKKYKTTFMNKPEIPNKKFSIKISIKKLN